MVNRRGTAVLALAMLVACSNGVPADAVQVSGRVLAGPTCPVEQADSPCPDAPVEVTLEFTADNGEVARTDTDGTGRYEVALSPGGYTVSVSGPGAGMGIIEPTQVTVAAAPTIIDFSVDTGIR